LHARIHDTAYYLKTAQNFAVKAAEEEDDIEGKTLALIELGACSALTNKHVLAAEYYGQLLFVI